MALAEILDIVSNDGNSPRLTQIGAIKIGGKSAQVRKTDSGGTWRAPEKWDSFKIVTMNRDAKGDLIPDEVLMSQLVDQYGDKDGKLRQIPIRVLSDEMDLVLQSSILWYGSKTLGAKSDGKTVTWFNSPEHTSYGRRLPEPKTEPWDNKFLDMTAPNKNPLFKIHTIFNCVIAAKEARWGGVYKFRTTSVISFRQLHASLLHLSQLTGGILSGMPLFMVLRPVQVSPDGKPTTVFVTHIELRGPELMELQQQAIAMGEFRVKFKERIEETTRQYRKLLAAPGTESAEDAKDISEELHPDEVDLPTVPVGTSYGLIDEPITEANTEKEITQ